MTECYSHEKKREVKERKGKKGGGREKYCFTEKNSVLMDKEERN